MVFKMLLLTALIAPSKKVAYSLLSISNRVIRIDPSNNFIKTGITTINSRRYSSSTSTSSEEFLDVYPYETEDANIKAPPHPSTFPSESYHSKDFFRYELIHQSSKSQARVGRIHTPHGIIDTPSFVAVATNGALKGLDFRDADDAGQQLVFCNTYHLLLQPGPDVIKDAGGLHKFMNRMDRPLITDSGGFQIFSLAYGSVQEELSNSTTSSKNDNNTSELKKQKQRFKSTQDRSKAVQVSENGVIFRSYRTGEKILLTPESSIQAQKSLGADIIIPLDELPPYHIDRDVLSESVDRTHRWEARSLQEHLKNINQQAIYAVIHGGIDKEFRTRSVNYLTSLPFDGYAIGGSLGKNHDELMSLLSWMMPMFDTTKHRQSKPRHLLGIADEPNILGSIPYGIDTFDSCYPTRLSRHGTLLTRKGKLHIKQGKHAKSYGIPIDDECTCKTCTQYDRAYLNHLIKAYEPLFMQLACQHNIHYMNDLMRGIREDIMNDKI